MMENLYVVELKRDHEHAAWVVIQRWPHGTNESHYFYDNNKNDRHYHDYFKQCCLRRPAGYELGDVVIDDQRQMFAEYKPISKRIRSNC